MTHDELLAKITKMKSWEEERPDGTTVLVIDFDDSLNAKALRAVVELHTPMKNSDIDDFGNDDIGCGGCGYDFDYSRWNNVYPCRTIKEIEGVLA